MDACLQTMDDPNELREEHQYLQMVEVDILTRAALKHDARSRRLLRAAANAIGRVRRASPEGVKKEIEIRTSDT
jgi:protein required for attachment to host cells